MIKTLAACAAVIALAGCASPVTRTATGEIPPARVYIKSMTQQDAGLSAIEFRRDAGLFNSQMLELAINDVVLAQIIGGEHLTIWLKPGSYTFSVKPAQGLTNTATTDQNKVVVEVKNGGAYRVRISSDTRGLKISLAQ
ncbi:NAD-GH domain containing protein [Herbaspirillum sp. alder98]|uniref:NAD-GH domain containing protein n=1 Tax=Herbaspirillum sp. alder98 TaxID=2913096 RepID=UPI001CD89B9B|nr:NAD-GH domain containing protein [Herbaspirillum sp. alder98]MCA1323066.1 NAD-GH domain containing protein [Herbaspirillum sp. alder98]